MSNYKLNEDKMFCDISDNTAIIINSETGIYYGMNPLGTCVFENIINGVKTSRILEELKSFKNAPESLEENFNFYLNALVENGILIQSEISDIIPKISEQIANDANFFIDVREYNDAQELLLADPIHEVKEEIGWQPDKKALNLDTEDVARRENKMV